MQMESTVVGLLQGIAHGDTSVGGRELLEVVQEASRRGEFLGDRAALLDRARARTRLTVPMLRQSVSRDRPLKTRHAAEEGLGLRATRELVEALDPVVRQLRELTFGQREPPFPSLDAAAGWIEQHSVDRWGSEGQEEEQEYSAAIAALDALSRRPDRWFSCAFSLQPLNVEYWRGDGAVHVRRVRLDTEPLVSILRWGALVAERTLLPPAGLLAFVLTGARPGQRVRLKGRTAVLPGLQVLSRRRLSTTNSHPGVSQIVIELDERELTDRNLRLVRQRATTLFQRRQRRTTAGQHRVVTVVRELGGPPRVRYDRAFWTCVAKRLGTSDPIAAARRYYRVAPVAGS